MIKIGNKIVFMTIRFPKMRENLKYLLYHNKPKSTNYNHRL